MRAVKVMLVVLSMVIVCNVAGAETFRFTASADNRPSESGDNLNRWEWLLDEMDRLFEDDEGVFHVMPGDFDAPEMTWVREAYESLPYIVDRPGPAGCETTTYSFDYGNAHFVAINEYYNGTTDTGADGDVVDALYNWLAADLAANTKPAVFVIGHEPAYPQFAHVGDSLDGHPENRDRFWKLLNDEKVIAYLCGHTHYYSALQQSQTGDYPCDAFTWQIDCGNAGNPREAAQTFVDVTVTDTDVTFTAWQGTEGVAFTVTEAWTVEIPFLAARNPSPADGATGVSPASVPLSATVENPSKTAGAVNVEFFGREGPTFSIVVLPDTQNYVNLLDAGTPEMFTSQTQWIADNAATMNIVFVTHEGDLTDNTDRPELGDVPAEWERANTSMTLLDGIVPYGLLPGNHDFSTTETDYYNTNFPYTRYVSEPWYGDHYPEGDEGGNDNNYQLFSAGGDDYIILHIEYNPNSSVTAWANTVLGTHSDRKAIITTHSYLNTNGSLTSDGGTIIWNDLVLPNDNVRFVLCGHISGERYELSTVGDREVHQLLANYQSRTNGGDGWLRIMTFEPDADEVHVQTYSPWLDNSETDGDSDFVLAFDMSSTNYSSIGSHSAVPSGSVATTPTPWPDLSMETQYEWYVTVTDLTPEPDLTVAGPDWSFTTASLKAGNPNPANGATGVDVDADLSWSAGIDAVSHDVYFGTDPGNLAPVSALQSETTYDPGTLAQGTTYYWVIDEFDIGDNLLAAGDIWSFTTALPQPVSIVLAGATWKYFDQVDSDEGAWYSPSFDDSQWGEGPAELGYGDTQATVIDGSPVRASYYFRHTFDSPAAYDNLTLNVVRDDGCVVYLNGVELGRSNMPAGDIYWDTWAASVTTNESDWWGISVDAAATIQPGTNVLAVSVHQAHSTSSDVSFDLELSGVALAVGQPVANDDLYTANEDETLTVTIDLGVLANDSDPDSDPITAVLDTDVSHGMLTLNDDGSFTYDPQPDFIGDDSFAYKAFDGTNYSGVATATITVENANDDGPPVANDDSAVTDRDVAVAIDVLTNDTDVDGDTLTVTNLTQPSNGSAAVNPDETVTYTPNPGHTGGDSFTYTANDGTANSNVATVTVTVNAPAPVGLFSDGFESGNLATGGWTSSGSVVVKEPAAYEGVYGVQIGGTASIVKSVSTVGFSEIHVKYARKTKGLDSGESLTVEWSIDGSAWNVIESIEDTDWLYRDIALGAGAGEEDGFSLRFRTNSNKTNEYAAVDSVEITGRPSGPVNQPPVAGDDAYSVDEDGTLIIAAPGVLANDSDPESDPLTAIPAGDVGNGVLNLNGDGSFSYTPNANFNGSDSFTYAANDGVSNSNTATVAITVNPINDAPVANNDSEITSEDTPVVVDVLANDNDLDGDTLSVQSATDGVNGGTVVNNVSSVTYTPALGYFGPDSFTYTVSDGQGGTDTANVSITVNEFNNPPVANDDADSTNEDSSVTIFVLANDTDADTGDTLSVHSATNGSNGSVVNNGDSVTYTPNANFNGTDVFTYTVSDGKGGADTGSVTVTVLAVNDPPSAGDDSAATDEDTAVVIDVLANDSDIDGDTLSVQSATNGANGSVVVNGDNTVTYTPDADYNGDDSFTYTISDGKSGTDTATVTVTVDPATLSVHVDAIDVTVFSTGRKYYATSTVTLDPQFAGATVVGDWYFKGVLRTTGQTATTDAGGTATFTSFSTPGKSGDTFEFVVTNVIATDYTYDEGSNVVASGSGTI